MSCQERNTTRRKCLILNGEKERTKIKSIRKSKKKQNSGRVKMNYTIRVYLDDGRIFAYDVESEEKVREHASAIINGGYRHNDGEIFEHYPPHRILKVKSKNIPTHYTDRVEGT